MKKSNDIGNKGFSTRSIHMQGHDVFTGSVMPPIYQTSTYIWSDMGSPSRYSYTRAGHPSRDVLEQTLSSLEGAKYAKVFSSGMAAMQATMHVLGQGAHILCTSDLYGGSYRLLEKIYKPMGFRVSYVDMGDMDALISLFERDKVDMVWMESISNPLLQVPDIEQISRLAHASGAYVVVDNTFATPYLCNPLSLGADMVHHSITKYISGHSDLLMGALVTNKKSLYEKIAFVHKTLGAISSPMDMYLTLRGIRTLSLRMDCHCLNATRVANFLSSHARVEEVYYPGLSTHSSHDIARRCMRGYSGMVCFTLREGTLEAAKRVISRLRLFLLAESLGGVESLVSLPTLMTHSSIDADNRVFPKDIIRLSVGIEDGADLEEDLRQALSEE